MKIDDDELVLALLFLDKLSHDFDENIIDLTNLHKKFDHDFFPYWEHFKEECKRLDKLHSFTITNYDPDFQKVLKYAFIQRDYHTEFSNGWHHEDLPKFIQENRDKLSIWLQQNPVLNEDIENIKKRKMALLGNIDDLIKNIDILLLEWKFKYYLTEEEL